MQLTNDTVFLSEDAPYLRPFICNGRFEDARVMLVGINPAMPIYPANIEAEEYLGLISDYDKFICYYVDSRKKANKKDVSRTRQGIASFTDWVSLLLGTPVIEANVYSYPTATVKELKQADVVVRNRSRELFFKVFVESNATVAVFHSAKAFRDFFELLEQKNIEYEGLNGFNRSCFEWKIETLEKMSPILKVMLPGKDVLVFAMRHLMYYGESGASFEPIRNKLKQFF